jgi:hypothetical protein
VIVAAVRQVADWLVNGSSGVNAQLATVPGDSADVIPPLVTIWDATRFEWVAQGRVLRDLTGSGPLLLVRGPTELEIPLFAGQQGGGWAPVDVIVAYVHRPTVEEPSEYVLRDAYQTLRAAARAIALQFPTMQASQERARVAFERPTVRFSAEQEQLDGEVLLASLTITLPAFDEWALGS